MNKYTHRYSLTLRTIDLRVMVMSKILFTLLAALTFAACTNSNDKMSKCENDTWDKVFPLSEKVNHKKVSFKTQYGFTLVGDLYTPKENDKVPSTKYAALAVSGPFGATKEQSSGLYAMKMAERGFVALAFDPSFTGESSGEPRRTASPDINTEDFMAAVDFLSKLPEVDAERIGIIGICGWGGIALNAAAADPRIKATVASTMYDMTRVAGNGYFDSADNETSRYEARQALAAQRLTAPQAMAGGVIDPLPSDAPQFVKASVRQQPFPILHQRDSFCRTNHARRERAQPLFRRSSVPFYGGRQAEGYKTVGAPNPCPENKELLIIPEASHCDLYDGGYTEPAGKGEPKNLIPWDKLAEFFNKNLK